jgi:hypothetical protein
MRYSATEKLEIIRLVEQSHLPQRRCLASLGIPYQDHRAQPAMADGFHLSEGHRLGVVLSLHLAG